MSWLPWCLLATTLTVRYLVARHNQAAFGLDLLTIPAWVAYYVHNQSWPLVTIPFIFGYFDVQALRKWWRV